MLRTFNGHPNIIRLLDQSATQKNNGQVKFCLYYSRVIPWVINCYITSAGILYALSSVSYGNCVGLY